MLNNLRELSIEKNILDIDENDTPKEGSLIDYDDPKKVADLVANHLGKIFVATHREKISKIIDNL